MASCLSISNMKQFIELDYLLLFMFQNLSSTGQKGSKGGICCLFIR